jgi:hypothetical protein
MIRRLVALAFIPVAVVFGEKPTLEHIYPTATAVGETNSLALTGKFEPWPPKIWCSTPGLDFTFPTNKDTVFLHVPADAKPGLCLIRVFNDEGASEPAIFVISESPHLRDAEPNDHFNKPQALTHLPATINGRLDRNNDVDSFSFEVKAGQWLDARMDCYTLKSKMDGVLRLTTTNGYQLAWNHDFSSFDPRLVWQAPYDQTVVLQAFGFEYPASSQIVLSGGSDSPYQLAVGISGSPPADLNGPLNEEASFTELCSGIVGVISPPGDQDSFPVSLKKDEYLEVHVDATSFGSELDPWVKIEDAEGKELARNDDAEGTRDALLEWKASEDGDYRIVVGSLTHGGEADWQYRLRVAKVQPDFRATIETSSIALESTGTNTLKISTKRLRGFTNELSVALMEAPEGLTMAPVTIDAKANEATLTLVTKDAPAFNSPIRIIVNDTVAKVDRPARFDLVSRSENNGVPGGYSKLLVESTEDLWLTIKSAPEKPTEKAAE